MNFRRAGGKERVSADDVEERDERGRRDEKDERDERDHMDENVGNGSRAKILWDKCLGVWRRLAAIEFAIAGQDGIHQAFLSDQVWGEYCPRIRTSKCLL